jgi:hypothetical protein
MTPVEMIRSRLLSDSDVTTLVGDRVYADAAPQGASFPFVVLATESGTGEDCLEGQMGFFSDTVGIDVYSHGRIDSLDVWKACWKSLNGYSTYDSDTILDSVTQSSGIAWATYRLSDASDELIYSIAQNLQVSYSIRGI